MSDATGSMTMTKISEKSPFAQELLVRDDCFILDNGANGKIFVWKGDKEPPTSDPQNTLLKCQRGSALESVPKHAKCYRR